MTYGLMLGWEAQVEIIRDGFEFELCSECLRDFDQHTISPDMFGNAHAWCQVDNDERNTP
jgi:hypothetical protein